MRVRSTNAQSSNGFSVLKRQAVSCLVFVTCGLAGYASLEGINYVAVRVEDGFIQSVNSYRQVGAIRGLIVGDSHPAYDIDPAALGIGWHNFAYPGENLIMTYMKLKYVLDQGQRPTCLILSLDYHNLSSYRINGADYSNYLEFDTARTMRETIGLKAWSRSLAKKHLPLLSSFNRRQFVEYLMKRLRMLKMGESGVSRTFTILPNGQLVSLRDGLTTKSLDERVELAAGRYQEQMKTPLVTPVLVEYFRKILTLCEDRGISIIGVQFPLSGSYMELLRTNPDMDQVDQVYDQ